RICIPSRSASEARLEPNVRSSLALRVDLSGIRMKLMNLYPKFVRHVLYPLVLWRRGELAEREHLAEFERTQFLPAAEIRDLQLRRLRVLLDFAYRNCPFYRDRFPQAHMIHTDVKRLDDLARLPALEKHEIQQHRDRLV